MAQILLLVLLDELQTRVHVLAPSLDFGVSQAGSSDSGGGGGGRRFQCSLRDDLVSQTLALLLRALTGLASANLTSEFNKGAHTWGRRREQTRLASVGESADARDKGKHL